MSPIRPDDPNDGTALVNQILARLRALERTRAALPDSANPLQTFENGSPLGDTRFLDFGPGVFASKVGDDYVLVTGAGAAGCSFDAIVDGSITVSDPEQCLFKGIGEALAYLASLSYTRAYVLVRGSSGVFNGTYTETANFTSPADVHLMGTGSSMLASGAGGGAPTWNLATFGCTTFTGLYISDIAVETGNKAGKSIFGTTAADAPYRLWMERVSVVPSVLSGTIPYSLQGTVARNCSIVGPCVASTNSLAINYFSECQFRMMGYTYSIASGSDSYLYMDDVTFWGSSDDNITLPRIAHVRGNNVNNTWSGTGTGAVLTLTSIGSTGRYDITCTNETVSGFGFKIAFSSVAEASLHGTFGDTTVGAPTSGQGHAIEISRGSNLDITGPATIDVLSTTTIILRGNGINGSAVTRRSGASGGTAVSFIAAVDNNVQVANGAVPGAGTTRSYNFDASSTGNLLLWHNHAAYPVAGTDAGTNNRVLPETAPPAGGIAPANADYLVGTANAGLSAEIVVGTTPGGELGGTWASPTVDATHSGSPHGVAIEDEGAAEGQALTVDFAGAGVSVGFAGTEATVTIPGVGTPTAGWGSITNVTVDRAYDANATTLDEIADVLGQLVADLIAQGVIAT